jgi:hypothetical protein
MPVPTTINDLSTVASSNYPAGSEPPSALDDSLRAHAAFIAKLRDDTAVMRYNTTTNTIEFVINGVVAASLNSGKLNVSSGILEFAGSNCYLVGDNNYLTLNADANDYMQYDRINNIWRWVIGGVEKAAHTVNSSFIFNRNLRHYASGPMVQTSEKVDAPLDQKNWKRETKNSEEIHYITNDADTAASVFDRISRNGFVVVFRRLLESGGRLLLGTVTDDGSTQLQVASLKVNGVAITGATPVIVTTSKRQTILSGPVFSDGSPNLFPNAVGGLTLTTNSLTTTPLIVTAAGGFSAAGEINRVGVATTSLSWTLPANNGPTHLYVDVDESGVLSPSWTTSAPIYRSGGNRPTASGGSDVFNVNEMYMSIGTGGTALKVFRVYLGSCAVGVDSIFAAGVGTAAYKAEYYGPVVSGLPAAGAQFDAVHNITPTGGDGFGVHAELEYKCLVANNGYAVGEVTNQMGASNGSYVFPIALRKFGSYVKAVAGSSGWILQNAASGAPASPPLASWSYRFICRRTW